MDARLPYLVTLILVAFGFVVSWIREVRKRHDVNVISMFATFFFTSLVMVGIVRLLDLIIGWLGLSERTEIAVWIGAGIGGGLLILIFTLIGDLNDSQSSEAEVTGFVIAFMVAMGGLAGAIVGWAALGIVVPVVEWLPERAQVTVAVGAAAGAVLGIFISLSEARDNGLVDLVMTSLLMVIPGVIVGLIASVTLLPFIDWLPDSALMGLGIGGGLGGDAGMFATIQQFAKEDDIREGKTGEFFGNLGISAVLAGIGGAIVGIIIGAVIG